MGTYLLATPDLKWDDPNRIETTTQKVTFAIIHLTNKWDVGRKRNPIYDYMDDIDIAKFRLLNDEAPVDLIEFREYMRRENTPRIDEMDEDDIRTTREFIRQATEHGDDVRIT